MNLVQETLVGITDRLQLVANLGIGMAIVVGLVICFAYFLVWHR